MKYVNRVGKYVTFATDTFKRRISVCNFIRLHFFAEDVLDIPVFLAMLVSRASVFEVGPASDPAHDMNYDRLLSRHSCFIWRSWRFHFEGDFFPYWHNADDRFLIRGGSQCRANSTLRQLRGDLRHMTLFNGGRSPRYTTRCLRMLCSNEQSHLKLLIQVHR